MAIFNQSNKQTEHASNITTIADGTKFSGKITIECELHIDGEVDAEIESTGLVRIGKSGRVKSTLKAKTLIVSGVFKGNAECETIELVSGGRVEGKLCSENLSIDSSCSFIGESIKKKSGANHDVMSIAPKPERLKTKSASPFKSLEKEIK